MSRIKQFFRVYAIFFFCITIQTSLMPLTQEEFDYLQKYKASQREELKFMAVLAAVCLLPLGIGLLADYMRSKAYKKEISKYTFADVAGAGEAKQELQEVVAYLKDPERFKRLGAKPPRGILLVGNPGNGKTLLAKALAGEAGCSFFSASGSEFIEVYVGVGASRVRDLFAKARRNGPSIIFIDEIDAIGSKRSGDDSGGHREHNQTINQLLTEMDGFSSDHGAPVIVIGATNRVDVLDPALLRPGRFDKKIEVPYPSVEDRKNILSVHAKNISIDAEVDFDLLARATSGFSGAELANLVNEAASRASKNPSQETVTQKDFDEARDTVIMGRAMSSKIMSPQERRITAYHEAGHALTRILVDDADPLYKVTIAPRGFSLGSTHAVPERDTYMQSREQMLAMIKICLGGRVAEVLVFKKLMTGASDDLERATRIARQIVCQYGMSDEVGPLVFDNETTYSEATLQHIDETVKKILMTAQREVMTLLSDNKAKLDAIAKGLLEQETLDASQVYGLIGIPKPSMVAI